ncbi:hypothetical protein EMCRGX_G020770 [Ephydatia muelleri]|eukprot:Em0016g701a
MMQAWTLLLCILSILGLAAAQQNPREGPQTPEARLRYNLSWSMPLVAVFIIVAVVFASVIYMVRRARYGAFCCITPRMGVFVQPDCEAVRIQDLQEPNTQPSPPSYEANPQPVTPSLPPPVYEDALHDPVTSTPARLSEPATMATVAEEDEAGDEANDMTPLNP